MGSFLFQFLMEVLTNKIMRITTAQYYSNGIGKHPKNKFISIINDSLFIHYRSAVRKLLSVRDTFQRHMDVFCRTFLIIVGAAVLLISISIFSTLGPLKHPRPHPEAVSGRAGRGLGHD